MSSDLGGKKVFLLNPPSVLGQAMLSAVLAAEYEIYVLKDPRRSLRVFQTFPDSIVFANIDSELSETEWQQYIARLLDTKAGLDLRVGVLSYNPQPALVEKYLMDMGVQCGFIRLKLGAQESTKIMLRALDANEARGRRKYVRVKCSDDSRVSLNVEILGKRHDGSILDISSVGMAIRFDGAPRIEPKSVLHAVQLRLRATLVRVDGVVLGARDDDTSVLVVLFKHEPDSRAKAKIRQYIHTSLQESIQKLVG